jgi:Pentapeptide repeats (9 copies)
MSVVQAQFNKATFQGGSARFRGATFHSDAEFDKASFLGGAGFRGATFHSRTKFNDATFMSGPGVKGKSRRRKCRTSRILTSTSAGYGLSGTPTAPIRRTPPAAG